jgi:hypothetical protein
MNTHSVFVVSAVLVLTVGCAAPVGDESDEAAANTTESVTSQAWYIRDSDGQGTGALHTNASVRYFHVGGTLENYGTDCNHLYVQTQNSAGGWVTRWDSMAVCNGRSKTVDVQGYLVHSTDKVRLRLCQASYAFLISCINEYYGL